VLGKIVALAGSWIANGDVKQAADAPLPDDV
jgi:hypothetical protein